MSRAGSLRVRDGTRISWSVAGRGPWLVLSHSLASDRGMWRPQLAALQARFTVLGYDTRGHGQSSVSADGFGFDTLAADVVALMDHLGVERARFMGLSMGGMTGLALALAHPERVERVVCCDARADAPDGFRANQFHLVRSERDLGLSSEARARRDELEMQVESVRARKGELSEPAYYDLLEPLLVELARLYEE